MNGKVSITLNIAVFLTLLGLIWNGSAWVTRLETRLTYIERQIDENRDNHWTSDDMRAWVQALQREVELWHARNPTSASPLRIPEAKGVRGGR